MQFYASVRDDELFPSFYHHHQHAFRQFHFLECVAELQSLFSKCHFHQLSCLFRDFDSEFVVVIRNREAQVELLCSGCDGAALYYQGHQCDEKHDVEYETGTFDLGDYRIGREDYRNCPAEPHPGNICL